jgi:WD40 repeat protein
MISNEPTGVKRFSEEPSLHANVSSLSRDRHDPFPDLATLPMNLIMGSILPFVQDRSTWNHLCVANKELRDGGRTIMTPPWPVTALPPQDQNFGTAAAFSPCGHYLACATISPIGNTSFVHILDRRHGNQTSLTGGNDQNVQCLSFSDDGKYLAGGGNDGLIRMWPANSSRKPTQQGLKSLPGHPFSTANCLAFASDSNILASGSDGAIKLWNVEDGACTQTFVLRNGNISSLVFSGVGERIQCLAATTDGSLIRISRSSNHSEFTSNVIVLGAARFLNTIFSSCGSFLATLDRTNKLCLYDIKTKGMSIMTQSVILPACCIRRTNTGMAFSPDNKMLAILGDATDKNDTAVRLFDVTGLRLKRQFKWQRRESSFPVALALDPSSRHLATACYDGSVKLWTA